MTGTDKILLAFSDEELLKVIAQNILGEYQIEKANTVAAAKRAMQTFTPDIIMVEERLEDGGGLAFAIELLTSEDGRDE